jgi:hypothetical protein
MGSPVFPTSSASGGTGAIIVPDDQFFDDNTARDAYFVSNPSKLVEGVQCVVGTTTLQLQVYRSSAWVDVTPVVRGPAGADGTSGEDGAPGSVIYEGTGQPGSGTGIAGDYYLDTVTRYLYGPKTTSWNLSSYVELGGISADAMLYKGAIDCSATPNYPAADAGNTYRVSVAGKIGGASGLDVTLGAILICNTDSTPSGNQATVGAYWDIFDAGTTGAVIGPASSTDGAVMLFDGTDGVLAKDSGIILNNLVKPTNYLYVGKNGSDSTGTGSAQAPYLTIGAAITAASAGTAIFIWPGTYVENLTFKAGVYLTSPVKFGVYITGNHTCSFSGTVIIDGIILQSSTGDTLTTSGATAFNLQILGGSSVNSGTGHAINWQATNADAKIYFEDGTCNVSTSGASACCIYATTGAAGSIIANRVSFKLNSAANIALSLGGALSFTHTSDEIYGQVVVSSTAAAAIALVHLTATGAAVLTTNSSGTSVLTEAVITTDTSPAIAGAGVFAFMALTYTTTGVGGAATLNGGLGASPLTMAPVRIRSSTLLPAGAVSAGYLDGTFEHNSTGLYWTQGTTRVRIDIPVINELIEETSIADGDFVVIYDVSASAIRKMTKANFVSGLTGGSLVKVSSNDTTPGYLNGKLVAGSGISFTEGSDGGNETLTIATSSVADHWISISSGYTATPASTSTLTMTSDLTGTLKPGYGLKYTIGGTVYYGVITAITSNLMTIAGASLSSDVSALYYTKTGVVQLPILIPGYYEDATSAGLLSEDLGQTLVWQQGPAYMVRALMYPRVVDGSSNGYANIRQGAATATGTAQAGAATTITFASGSSGTDDFYNNMWIRITSGTGIGQSRKITDYVGSTKVATVATWTTNPDATSVYEIVTPIVNSNTYSGLLLDTTAAKNTVIDIDTSKYAITYGDSISVMALKGTGGDAQDLSAMLTYVVA